MAAKCWRYCWALPATMLGLLVAGLAWPRGRVRVVDGVLEYSRDFLAGGLGRVVLADAVRGTVLPIASELRTPTHMVRDVRTGDLFVTEFGPGRIVRVLVPR